MKNFLAPGAPDEWEETVMLSLLEFSADTKGAFSVDDVIAKQGKLTDNHGLSSFGLEPEVVQWLHDPSVFAPSDGPVDETESVGTTVDMDEIRAYTAAALPEGHKGQKGGHGDEL